MKQPLVSIVILNWNGRRFLEQFLPSVMATTYNNKEVVVVDNASTDDSVDFLKKEYPAVKIVVNAANYGFTKGYNEGLKHVTADYYVLLNSDVEVDKGWVEPIISLMEADKTIGACQPKLLQHADHNLFEYAGAAGGWIDYLGYPFARGRVFDYCEKDEGQYDQPMPIFWASGAAMFIRPELFHRLGGFDEFFFAHQEEIDLCWRIQLAGYQVYACPQSVVYHVGGGTLPKGNARKVFLNFRNNLIMMAKNLPLGSAIWKIFYRFWLDAISAVKSLLAGEGTYFIAVVKAHFAFLYWLLIHKKTKREGVDKRRKLNGFFHKSVVWSYFVRGKKTFVEIVGAKC
ncbi:glycosyltransferase family 2 protein [Pseudoflavitalea sp. G-6-1-2]|uniref:glycosyltransferase family 2 protein n=1 Tax=Pseudoflavitalea sp. G-6-1-2 TaxID=2728841 RepID=UPI00146B8EEE|nr:glycosyltransferase family 2 protein [Pseudoflavitalea sp. G-6-1-2]NML22080.1 glycosyltransferase family 2 protein [Pseudoflavitalea sp. G-6-1-2]